MKKYIYINGELSNYNFRGNLGKKIKSLKLEKEFCAKFSKYGCEEKHYYYLASVGELPEIEKCGFEKKKLVKKDIKFSWAARLSKLTDLGIEDCLIIAKEKLDFKEKEIEVLENRQFEKYSRERDKLIRKKQKENPLRRIQDVSHAQNILLASHRHNATSYDSYLIEARELVLVGELSYCEVKDYARKKIAC